MARHAHTARDLERNDGLVARHYRGDLVTYFKDLDDALVAEGVGSREREATTKNSNVEITGSYRDWTHQCCARTGKRRIRNFLPELGGRSSEHEPLHGPSLPIHMSHVKRSLFFMMRRTARLALWSDGS
jgi:hypothetical protein